MIVLTLTIFNSITVSAATVAYQSDSSGFIALLSYISLIYFFVSDKIIFKEIFSAVELGAAIVILTVVVTITIIKIKRLKKAEK